MWNSLPASVNFSTLGSIRYSITVLMLILPLFLNTHKPSFSLFSHCDFILYSTIVLVALNVRYLGQLLVPFFEPCCPAHGVLRTIIVIVLVLS